MGRGPLGWGGCLTPGQGLTAASPSRKGTHLVLWTQEQEEELTRLFEEFQGSEGEQGWGRQPPSSPLQPPAAPCPDPPFPADVLGNIMRHLTARRSRARVVEKLLGLGLVSERKELYKKRRRKGHGPGLVRGGWEECPLGAALTRAP